ncbi:putative host-nuclease inhibitor protein Gam [Shigella sonnei]|nr:putative host-nuclease inhibitor protein Gam [Shigella sonnei]
MSAYPIFDRIEEMAWARHYQQIVREEKETELADDLEKGLPQHLFESLCIDHLQRHGANKQAISHAFDDDVESGDALPIDLLTVRRTLLCAGVQDMSMTFSKVMMANASWQKPV